MRVFCNGISCRKYYVSEERGISCCNMKMIGPAVKMKFFSCVLFHESFSIVSCPEENLLIRKAKVYNLRNTKSSGNIYICLLNLTDLFLLLCDIFEKPKKSIIYSNFRHTLNSYTWFAFYCILLL